MRLNKFKSFYKNKKFVQIREKSNHHDIEILKRNDPDQDFNKILHTLCQNLENIFQNGSSIKRYLVKSNTNGWLLSDMDVIFIK